MVYYIFCSSLFIFAWLFIGIFFVKLGAKITLVIFFVFFNPPLLPDIEKKSAMIDLEKEVVIYFWYGKPRLNAFSGIWNLVRLQNEHKQKELSLPEFPNFLSVQARNKISKSITVKSALLWNIQKRGFQYTYCFDLLQHVLFILIKAMQKYKIIKFFF